MFSFQRHTPRQFMRLKEHLHFWAGRQREVLSSLRPGGRSTPGFPPPHHTQPDCHCHDWIAKTKDLFCICRYFSWKGCKVARLQYLIVGGWSLLLRFEEKIQFAWVLPTGCLNNQRFPARYYADIDDISSGLILLGTVSYAKHFEIQRPRSILTVHPLKTPLTLQLHLIFCRAIS